MTGLPEILAEHANEVLDMAKIGIDVTRQVLTNLRGANVMHEAVNSLREGAIATVGRDPRVNLEVARIKSEQVEMPRHRSMR